MSTRLTWLLLVLFLSVQGAQAQPGGGSAGGGQRGAPGGAITIRYTFDAATTDSDPGSGKLRLGNTTQNASTVVRVSLIDKASTSWQSANSGASNS